MIDKRKAQPATQNTDLTEPASPGDVNEVNSRKAGCTEPEQKTDQSAKIDLPDPDLTRLFKNRARDGDIIKKCKIMLVAGVPPGKVALLLRLPLERVIELYNSSYNPRCRRFANPNNGRLIITMWHEGAMLADICQALGLPLFTVVMSLRGDGVTNAAMAPRMPEYDDPLYVEYRQVVARKAASKSRPIQINPVRRVRKSQQTTTASQTATA
ncbi:hypothetical protein B6J47_26875 [Klebsiella pneumoniae]|uniref:hypothetical protein n=1 Tax=Enterobacteriaceae TaxID=543 RepID=UPI00032E2540|nr:MULTISPECIES: hypothetical protein [Klebsiella/Raoultella group]EJG2380216.1 hypothetical protein [Raoultella ornithinolytica]EOQ47708.1 hypothetical protein A1WC_04184 [Klebsiella sp. KTE92]MCJ5546986.1 hypothetical protein [Klebsiella quasipneumoniae]MDD9254483.1 hypothetical protein [Klebsiella variicola]MDZ0182393.1 hypothetical protein [Klebsiella quasipneumoniae]